MWGIRPSDGAFAVGLNAALIVGMWVRHGGLRPIGSVAGALTAAGQLTALLGTFAILVQILLMSRAPLVERAFGMDRLAHWHRWLGFVATNLIIGHVLFTTLGYAASDHARASSELWRMLTTYPDVLMAGMTTVLIVGVAVSSVRAARRKLSYETWHFIHFYTYLAIALGFAHQLAVGTDFINDAVARGYWIALYAVVFGALVVYRVVEPLRLSARHRLRVAKVVGEAPGVTSVYVTGRDLHELHSRAGQFFKWRFFTGKTTAAHPFSLSAAPNGRYLRVTIRDVGDRTHDIQRLRPGTRVAIEGPYGVFTAGLRARREVLLIAGGIGIAPIRALLEDLGGDAVLLYRARSEQDVIFRSELDQIVAARGGAIHYLVGTRAELGHDPLSAAEIARRVPDVEERDIFVCGPAGMMQDVHESMSTLGIPDDRIHYERFALV